ncbi:helix-turn-helix domain-containing protein [Aquitalea magnusonii]|uniref:helix-turn-helix domain-containing protein n=1 Tax=Aquitalea magnusonii TaxID=332411 RepID=UPI0007502169|nr:helix-turn-helix transcriptional regulator [Aquitalea magnusonii]
MERCKEHLYFHDMKYIETGARITAARKAKGLTQPDLAELLGITAQAVQQWEAGKTMPRGHQRQQMVADALGVTVAELFFGITQQENSARPGLIEVWEPDLTDQEGVLAAAGRARRRDGEDASLVELCAALARMLEQKTEECRQLQEQIRQLDPNWGKYS